MPDARLSGRLRSRSASEPARLRIRPRARAKGAYPCVTGVSCSPWPRSSASATFVYAPFAPDWWLPNPRGRAAPRRLDVRPRDRQPVRDHPLDHRDRLHRHPDRPGLGGLEVRRRARPGGDLLPRQPAARGDLDDHPGGDPGLHRPLPDGDLGEHQVPERGAQGPAAGRGHRPAVPVGDALPRPRRQAAHAPTTCTRSTTCTSSRTRRP